MKKFAIIILTLLLAVPGFAQGRYGKDSAECVKYLSYYSELVKQNNLKDAAPFWRQAFSLCPSSRGRAAPARHRSHLPQGALSSWPK